MMLTMNAFTCIGLFCLIATACAALMPGLELLKLEPIPAKYMVDKNHMPTETPSPTETSPYCSNGTCAGVSYEEILKLYGDLFFTKEELQKKLEEKKEYTIKMQKPNLQDMASSHMLRRRNSGSPSDHDGDRCCPTFTASTYPTEMINTQNHKRFIVHFDGLQPNPMYQLIARGKCTYWGKCRNCQQEYAMHSILVVDETFKKDPPFEFDYFYISSYCSCKG